MTSFDFKKRHVTCKTRKPNIDISKNSHVRRQYALRMCKINQLCTRKVTLRMAAKYAYLSFSATPDYIYALIFYPPKSNSKSILILIRVLEFLNYHLESNLTNCVSPDLKFHNW